MFIKDKENLKRAKQQILPPKRYDGHTRHFFRGVLPPGVGLINGVVAMCGSFRAPSLRAEPPISFLRREEGNRGSTRRLRAPGQKTKWP